MKIKVLISTVLATAFLFTGVAFAEGTAQTLQTDQTAQTTQSVQTPKPIEVPDIKIIMDGEITKFQKVPLSVSNSTLLPLRELLVKLGVPNDDKHIIYNGTEKSVTVWDGQTKIYLLINQKEAFVDDKPITLNAAPILYQNSTYIPLRFVAEALNRKVIWDGSMKAAFICDIAKYDSLKLLLDKSNEESGKVKKNKQETYVTGILELEAGKTEFGAHSQADIDNKGKDMSMKTQINIMGMSISSESYYYDNAMYIKDMVTSGWSKKIYKPEEYNKLFENKEYENLLTKAEVLCAGLNQVSDESADEIVLEGDVFLVDYFKKAIDEQSLGFNQDTKQEIKYNDFSLRISLDKNNALINSIEMYVKMLQPATNAEAGADTKMDMEFEIRFSEYDGDFVVSIPEEAVKNAVPVD